VRVILRFETRELEKVPFLTYYNHVCHKLKVPFMEATHLYECCDDVGFEPSYKIGKFVDEKFITLFWGEGDAIPEGRETTGGVWVDIEVDKVGLLNTVR